MCVEQHSGPFRMVHERIAVVLEGLDQGVSQPLVLIRRVYPMPFDQDGPASDPSLELSAYTRMVKLDTSVTRDGVTDSCHRGAKVCVG